MTATCELNHGPPDLPIGYDRLRSRTGARTSRERHAPVKRLSFPRNSGLRVQSVPPALDVDHGGGWDVSDAGGSHHVEVVRFPASGWPVVNIRSAVTVAVAPSSADL